MTEKIQFYWEYYGLQVAEEINHVYRKQWLVKVTNTTMAKKSYKYDLMDTHN